MPPKLTPQEMLPKVVQQQMKTEMETHTPMMKERMLQMMAAPWMGSMVPLGVEEAAGVAGHHPSLPSPLWTEATRSNIEVPPRPWQPSRCAARVAAPVAAHSFSPPEPGNGHLQQLRDGLVCVIAA